MKTSVTTSLDKKTKMGIRAGILSLSGFKKRLSVLSVLLSFSFLAFAQNRVYVSSIATGNNNGTTWANAYTNLQTAIDASNAGDSLWVKAGTYFPTKTIGTSTDGRSKSFILTKNVHIYGGFAGNETKFNQRITTNITILSGDLGMANDSTDNAYHVVLGLNFSGTLSWLEIKSGFASGTGADVVAGFSIDKNKGAGLYLDSGAAKIEYAKIYQNLATNGGAGVYNRKSAATFLMCLIEQNRIHGLDASSGGGAGMFNVQSDVDLVDYNTIQYNRCRGVQGGGGMRNEDSNPIIFGATFMQNAAIGGDGGGGIYNLNSTLVIGKTDFSFNNTNEEAGAIYNDGSPGTYSNVNFNNNTSGSGGAGAIENDGGSDVSFTDCIFNFNTSLGHGGAIQNWKSSIELTRVTFNENTAGGSGGAVYNYNQSSPKITNCIFYKNEAGGNGGAFYNERDSHPIITSSTFAKNKATLNGGGIYIKAGAAACNPILTNVTIAYNTALVSGGGAWDDGLGASLLRNSIVFGNIAPTLPDISAPIALLATAVFNDIIGNEFYATGLTPPVIFTANVFGDTSKIFMPIDSAGPAFNTGSNVYFSATATPNLFVDTNDVRGAARIMGIAIDLGAYEFCTTNIVASISLTNTPIFPVLENTKVAFSAAVTNQGAHPRYEWYVNDTLVQSIFSSQIILTAGTDFNTGDEIKVKLISSRPCALAQPADSMVATVNYIGINEIEKNKNAMQLFPNPNRGDFKLKTNVVANENYMLIITDLSGNVLHKENLNVSSDWLETDVHLGKSLPSGMYILALQSMQDVKVPIRFVVQ